MSPQKTAGTSGTLADISEQLAASVEIASRSVVAIHARRRIPSSGIVWRDGIIVSASHTVRREDEIPITLPDGKDATATIAGRDSASDLIALRLSGATPRVAGKTDSDSARVGSLVLAVGRPGRNTTASFGIVSAISDSWRTWQGARLERVLRLDLAIYDGFSGGPLVDAAGRVLGVNNSALARGTPAALPASLVDRVVDELLDRGHVRRAFIGIAVHPVALSESLAEQHKLPHESALIVMSVADGAPADQAGIFVGDVLLDANEQSLRRPTDLLDVLSNVPEGGSIQLKLLRGGTVKTVSVTPVDRAQRRSGR